MHLLFTCPGCASSNELWPARVIVRHTINSFAHNPHLPASFAISTSIFVGYYCPS